jgi:hypothetical protein
VTEGIEQLQGELAALRERHTQIERERVEASKALACEQAELARLGKAYNIAGAKCAEARTTERTITAKAADDFVDDHIADVNASAHKIQGSTEVTSFLEKTLLRLAQYRLPLQSEKALEANVVEKQLLSDLAGLNVKISECELLSALGPAALLEGNIKVVGAKTQHLMRLAEQAAQDLQRARTALDDERKRQETARAKRSGPITWSNQI